MKFKKSYAIEVPITKAEFDAQEGKTIAAVDKLAETLGLKTALVETKEIDETS